MNKLKQVFECSGLIGKTVSNAFEDNEKFFISFTDKTFAVLHSYETSESVYIETYNYDQTPTKHNYDVLYELGVIDVAKRDEILEEINRDKQQIRQQNEKYEIEQLKRLQSKYPNI